MATKKSYNLLHLISLVLLIIGLWQVEIVWWVPSNELWYAPFYLFSLHKDVARDLWYGVIVASWIICAIAGKVGE